MKGDSWRERKKDYQSKGFTSAQITVHLLIKHTISRLCIWQRQVMVHSDRNYSIASFFSPFCVYIFSLFSPYIADAIIAASSVLSQVEKDVLLHTHAHPHKWFHFIHEPSEKIPLHLFYWLHAHDTFFMIIFRNFMAQQNSQVLNQQLTYFSVKSNAITLQNLLP